MRLSKVISKASLLAAIGPAASAPDSAGNSTYYNPVLPGWHSDPSCTQVDGTHAWSRESQLPGVSANTAGQQSGMYAATIRHRDGVFHVICEYLGAGYPSLGVIFTSADPFDERTWSDPVTFPAERIDPDLFWDDDGRAYVATQGVVLQEIDLATSALSQPPIRLWNGTGGASPEGPHLYRKDGYLLPADRRRRHGDEPLDHDRAGAGPQGPVRALRAQPDPHEPRHGRVLPDGRPRRPVPGRRGELVGHVSDDALRPGLGDLPYGPRGRAVPRDVGRGRVGRCRSPSGGTIERLGPVTGTPPAPRIVPVPSAWAGAKIRLLIQTLNSTHYSLAAMPAGNPKAKLVIGTASAGLYISATESIQS
ncbi:glycosyl hydrolase [Ustulina deusta]|nr:glycosyl hydrolase [Ustulina deusta]